MNTDPSLPLIVRIPPANWPALAPFIVRHNQAPVSVPGQAPQPRCLHAHQGDTLAQHVDDLSALSPDKAAFWASPDAHAPTGLIGCEFDPALRRAWVRGPLVAPDAAPGLSRALLQALETGLPDMERFDAFPTEADPALNQVYAEAGYQRQAVHRVMEASLADDSVHAAASAAHGIVRAEAWQLPSLLALHGELFPTGYLKDSDFEAALKAEDRLLLACVADGRCIGYLHAQDEPAQDEIYVDYVGVATAARGQGLGRALLLQAMAWGRSLGRRRASLTAREDRAAALNLYLRLGYVQVSAGVHWRKDRA